MIQAHEEGKDVARLCSGDPSLYSALAEQTRRLDRAGVPWDVTPGVPAYAAAAALLGRELTVPEVAQTVILTRAQQDSTAMPDDGVADRARPQSGDPGAAPGDPAHPGAGRRNWRRATGPAARRSWSPMPPGRDQRILRGTLADIADQVEAAGLRQAAVIMVGEVFRAEGFVESHLYGKRFRGPDNGDDELD